MSNNINNNPFILDTVADDIVPATIDLRPRAMLYSGGTTAGHAATIEDAAEIEKCTLTVTANGDTVSFYFPPGYVMKGLSLGVLGSGKVYLYF